MKKGIMLLLGLTCATACAGFVACDEAGEPHECPKYVTYTLTLTGDGDDAVVIPDVMVKLYKVDGETEEVFAKGVTDSNGQFVGVAEVGEYTLELFGYNTELWSFGTDGKQTITIAEDTAEVTVWMNDITPNGSEERPYTMTAVDITVEESILAGDNKITVEAGKTVYYNIQASNEKIAFTSVDDFEVIYGEGDPIAPTEGVAEITGFEVGTPGPGQDPKWVLVGIKNKSAENTATVAVSYPQPAPEEATIAVGDNVSIVLNAGNEYMMIFVLDNVAAGNYTVTLSNYAGTDEIDIESAPDKETLGEYVYFTENGSDTLKVTEGDTVLKVYLYGVQSPTGEYTCTITLTPVEAA